MLATKASRLVELYRFMALVQKEMSFSILAEAPF